MSCNGCRVLRKGCSDNCILRHCLQWIDGAEAQGHATLFVAKFFGRAGMLGFVSGVPESQRPALFHSLLFEACGRTINPVSGAVGLLCTGNWQACQSAVETVLNGGFLYPSSTNRGPIRVPFMQMRKSSSNLLQDGEKLPRVRVGRGFLPSPFASASPFEIKQTARTDFIEENFIGAKRKFDSFDILESNAGFESCRVKAKIDPEQSLVCNDFDDHIELDLTLGGSNGSNNKFESKARSGSPSSSCTCAHS